MKSNSPVPNNDILVEIPPVHEWDFKFWPKSH